LGKHWSFVATLGGLCSHRFETSLTQGEKEMPLENFYSNVESISTTPYPLEIYLLTIILGSIFFLDSHYSILKTLTIDSWQQNNLNFPFISVHFCFQFPTLTATMRVPSVNKIFLSAFFVASLVSAHGKVSVATGDAGGNGTALGSKSYSRRRK
jgi:hypothetical protein